MSTTLTTEGNIKSNKVKTYGLTKFLVALNSRDLTNLRNYQIIYLVVCDLLKKKVTNEVKSVQYKCHAINVRMLNDRTAWRS